MKRNENTNHTSSAERYEAFIHNNSEAIWRIEIDKPVSTELSPKQQIKLFYKHAYLAEANLAMAKMYGFRSSKPMIGLRLGDLLVESDPENAAYLEAFIESGYNLSGVESHEKDKDGNDKYFRNSLVGIVEDGNIIRAWGTQQDVTKEKVSSEALERSRERLTLALQASNMGIWEWDINANNLYWSTELKELFGLKRNDSINYEKYMSMLHPDDRTMVKACIEQSMKTGDSYHLEHRLIWPDGSVHWLNGRGQAYLKNGKAIRMVGTSANIDAQKRLEETLLRQNEYLNTLHTAAVEANQGLAHHNKVLETILAQACEISGTKHGYVYLLTSGNDEMVVEVATGLFKAHLGHTIAKGEGLAGKVWKTGKPVLVSDYDKWPNRQKKFPKGLFRSAVGVPLQTSSGIVGVIALGDKQAGRKFDTEQLGALSRLADLACITISNARLFNELQESEQRFRNMADTAPVMIWATGPDMRATYFNRPWLEFRGRKLYQETGFGFRRGIHKLDHDRTLQIYEAAFEKQKPFTLEHRLKRHDGQYRWVIVNGTPRFSTKGSFQGFIGSALDIHDLKRAEELAIANVQLKTQRSQLLALNKAKDDFIALASHQLRTPATVVKQYISLLINEFGGPLTVDQLQYLQIAFNSNERQLRVINDLLKTAQLDSSRYTLEKHNQNLVAVIKESIDEMEIAFDMKNQIALYEGPKKAEVEIDASEFKLVLINLLENASKYSYSKDEIIVHLKQSEHWLEISITDTGVGIAEKDQQKIFHKFTRVDNNLSDTVTGSGLGLYWVKRIIKMHGGTIRVRSTLGEGSSFIIRLPL